MERHSGTFPVSSQLVHTDRTTGNPVHFKSSDEAQRSNDATSPGQDTGCNSLKSQSPGKMATNQSEKPPESDQPSVLPLCFKQYEPEPKREPSPSVAPPAPAEPPVSTKSTPTQSPDDSRSSGGTSPYDRLRPLVSRIRGIHFHEVSGIVDGMGREDAQALADFLSTVLSQETGILATDEGNRILVVLCKLATRAQVYPQRYALEDVKCNYESIVGGGCAYVYEGWHQNRPVCVKAIRNSRGKSLRAFIKELMIWAHLSHHNILPFYGVCKISETFQICLVSPRMRNGTLHEYALELPQKSRTPLIFDVVKGVMYIHKLHIVHSDLKGDNVLVSDEGRALIMDFGISHIATATAQQKHTTSPIGRTIYWTAPEITDSEESIRPTKPSDVWSFACLCYEVLSRRIPFHQYKIEAQVVRAFLRREIPQRPKPGHDDWDEIDDRMWGLMTSCWEYAPEDRPNLQDIYNSFVGLNIQDDRVKVLMSSETESDLTISRSMSESAYIDFERVQKVLLKLPERNITDDQLNHEPASGSQDPYDVEQELPSIPEQPSFPFLDEGAPLSQLPPSLPDPNPVQDVSPTHAASDPGLIPEYVQHIVSPATQSQQKEQDSHGRTGPLPSYGISPPVRSSLPQVDATTSKSARASSSMTGTVINAIKAIRHDDIIIAFMGPSGSGKSFFIDLLTGQLGQHNQRARNGLRSIASQIQATRVRHRRYGDRIVLVDTPGLGDATRSDMEILTMIGDWLQKTYEKDIKLSGLIYLHPITENQMQGIPLQNLRMFGELCGDVAMNQVILVSNMWQKVKPEVGVAREEELKSKFWKPLVERGSRVDRLMDARGSEAWRIIEQLIGDKDKREAVLLQEELVELQKKLNETQAGKTLYTTLQKALDDQRESLKSLVAHVEKSNDLALAKELRREYEKIEKEFQRTFGEVKKLKIPLGRRIMNFFFGKRARAKAVKVKDNL